MSTSDLRWCWFGSGFFGAGSVVWRFSTSSFSPNKSFVLERTLSAALKLWTSDYSIGFMFVALLMVNRCRIEAAI